MKKDANNQSKTIQKLALSTGGYSDIGTRDINQDAFAIKQPTLHSEKNTKE